MPESSANRSCPETGSKETFFGTMRPNCDRLADLPEVVGEHGRRWIGRMENQVSRTLRTGVRQSEPL